MNTVISYHKYSPGGNITALVLIHGIENRQDVASRIMHQDPEIEQVGFIESFQDADISIAMGGSEFCGNAARCLAFHYFLETQKKKLTLKMSGFDAQMEAEITSLNEVVLTLPSSFISEILSVPEGYLVGMQGIRFLITETKLRLDELDQLSFLYGKGTPAFGVVQINKNDDITTISPWVKVFKTSTAMFESACGSGSIAAALALMQESTTQATFVLQQPSSSLYTVTFFQGEDGLSYIRFGGPVNLVSSNNLIK